MLTTLIILRILVKAGIIKQTSWLHPDRIIRLGTKLFHDLRGYFIPFPVKG